jgi:RNA polymerase sigma factor (sigma-70 family)
LDHCLLEQDINERKKILEKELEISEGNLDNMIYISRFLHIASIDQPITDKVGNRFTFHEIFFDKEEPLIEDIAVNELDQSNLSKLLDQVMSVCLSEKEITCLIEYYYEEMTLDQIGERYKLSRERIRQIIVTAKRKIRHYSKAHACYLSAYLD